LADQPHLAALPASLSAGPAVDVQNVSAGPPGPNGPANSASGIAPSGNGSSKAISMKKRSLA